MQRPLHVVIGLAHMCVCVDAMYVTIILAVQLCHFINRAVPCTSGNSMPIEVLVVCECLNMVYSFEIVAYILARDSCFRGVAWRGVISGGMYMMA